MSVELSHVLAWAQIDGQTCTARLILVESIGVSGCKRLQMSIHIRRTTTHQVSQTLQAIFQIASRRRPKGPIIFLGRNQGELLVNEHFTCADSFFIVRLPRDPLVVRQSAVSCRKRGGGGDGCQTTGTPSKFVRSGVNVRK